MSKKNTESEENILVKKYFWKKGTLKVLSPLIFALILIVKIRLTANLSIYEKIIIL